MPSILYDVSFKSRQLTQDELIAQIELEPVRYSFMHHLLDEFCLSDLAKDCVKEVVLSVESV